MHAPSSINIAQYGTSGATLRFERHNRSGGIWPNLDAVAAGTAAGLDNGVAADRLRQEGVVRLRKAPHSLRPPTRTPHPSQSTVVCSSRHASTYIGMATQNAVLATARRGCRLGAPAGTCKVV